MTPGQSTTAIFVEQELEDGQRRLNESISVGRDLLLEELATVVEDCKHVGWDGCNAALVEQDTLRNAYFLIESLPFGVPHPSIGAEPDGHLTLDWYRSPQRTLSVSVSPDGDLHFAALLGTRTRYGTEPFSGDFPQSILTLIREVFS
jgi:hypothetical protein